MTMLLFCSIYVYINISYIFQSGQTGNPIQSGSKQTKEPICLKEQTKHMIELFEGTNKTHVCFGKPKYDLAFEVSPRKDTVAFVDGDGEKGK